METVARLNAGETLGGRILKVDHAGEHGAVNIYRGQRLASRWRRPEFRAELADFQSHEERHREIFSKELQRRGIRRCRSYHLCGIGGFALGISTGLLGRAAVSATTVAVERVVLKHLKGQLQDLHEVDVDAYRALSAILADEQAHHDQAVLETVQGAFWPRVIRPIVGASTEAVIWLGMHL